MYSLTDGGSVWKSLGSTTEGSGLARRTTSLEAMGAYESRRLEGGQNGDPQYQAQI